MALTDVAIRGTKPSKRPYKVYDCDGLFLLINSGVQSWAEALCFLCGAQKVGRQR
jgi:hypothetical protein